MFFQKDGDMIQKQQHCLFNRADEAWDLLRSHIDQGHVVRIVSHNDADGLTSAGIFANAINVIIIDILVQIVAINNIFKLIPFYK